MIEIEHLVKQYNDFRLEISMNIPDNRVVGIIGKNGCTGQVETQIDEALTAHELIKIKFIDYIDEKKEIAAGITEKLKCECCGSIGHTFIFFRQNEDPAKRKIEL